MVGAGVSGLAAAHELAKRGGDDVRVTEASVGDHRRGSHPDVDRLGGRFDDDEHGVDRVAQTREGPDASLEIGDHQGDAGIHGPEQLLR